MNKMENKLFLNQDLYGRKSIQEARMDYKKLAKIEMEEADGYWICSFLQCTYGLKRTMLEFENYLIGLSNRERQ